MIESHNIRKNKAPKEPKYRGLQKDILLFMSFINHN